MVGGEWWVVSGEGEGEGRLFWIFVAAASRHFVPLPTLLKLEKPLEAEGVEYCTILYILSKYDMVRVQNLRPSDAIGCFNDATQLGIGMIRHNPTHHEHEPWRTLLVTTHLPAPLTQ